MTEKGKASHDHQKHEIGKKVKPRNSEVHRPGAEVRIDGVHAEGDMTVVGVGKGVTVSNAISRGDITCVAISSMTPPDVIDAAMRFLNGKKK
jgi:hypothetical protein